MVGREGHSTVEEHLKVGPHLVDGAFAGYFQHAGEHGEHPGGHSGEVGDVLADGLAGDAVALHLEVGEQGGFFLGHPEQVGQRVDVLDEDGAEVTHQTVAGLVVGSVAAAEDQRLTVKDTALGVVAQIDGHGVEAAGVMDVLQSFAAHRDELALVVGRAG